MKKKTPKRDKPLAPWLPGKFGRMTRRELDAEADRYDAEFAALDEPNVANSRPLPKKRGRPRKPASERSARVLITIEPRLLTEADVVAERAGLTRAGLIQRALRDWLQKQPKRRRSA